jgi:CheY-like chemotaxis protein
MKKKNVLIVDDDKDVLLVLKDGLEEYKDKFQTAFADNIHKAKEIISKFEVSTVVTDVKMPGGSGVDLLLFLRKWHPKIKVIIMTGFADEEIKRSVLKGGAFAFFKKPLDLAKLGKTILESFDEKKSDILNVLSLPDILQFMALGKYFGSILVTGPDNLKGRILVKDGKFMEANVEGKIFNLDAVVIMLSWENPEIVSAPTPEDIPNEPFGSIQGILMKASKILDESK